MRIKYIDGKRTFTLTDKNLPSGMSSDYADVEKWERFKSQNIFNTTPVAGTELKKGDVIMSSGRFDTNFFKVIKMTNHKVFVTSLPSKRVIYEYGRFHPFHGECLVEYRVTKTEDSIARTEYDWPEYKRMLNIKNIFHKVFDKNKMYEAREIYLD